MSYQWYYEQHKKKHPDGAPLDEAQWAKITYSPTCGCLICQSKKPSTEEKAEMTEWEQYLKYVYGQSNLITNYSFDGWKQMVKAKKPETATQIGLNEQLEQIQPTGPSVDWKYITADIPLKPTGLIGPFGGKFKKYAKPMAQTYSNIKPDELVKETALTPETAPDHLFHPIIGRSGVKVPSIDATSTREYVSLQIRPIGENIKCGMIRIQLGQQEQETPVTKKLYAYLLKIEAKQPSHHGSGALYFAAQARPIGGRYRVKIVIPGPEFNRPRGAVFVIKSWALRELITGVLEGKTSKKKSASTWAGIPIEEPKLDWLDKELDEAEDLWLEDAGDE